MAETSIKHEIDSLQADLAQLRKDLVGLTKVIGTLTANAAEANLDSAQKVGDEMQERLHETAAVLKGSMEKQIAQRPLITMLIAFGVGILLGKAADRS